jgi:hypothetical protein
MFCSRALLLPSLQSRAMTRCLQCDVAMGNTSSKSNPPPAAPAPSFQYADPFLGRTLRIPPDQRAQVDAPLHVIAAAAARLHLPRGHPLAHEQTLSPSSYMRVSLWPAQLQRAAIGFAAAASHGLATAPASVDVSARTTWHWRTRVLRRVMGGYVGKIQVHSRLRAVIVVKQFCILQDCALSSLCVLLTSAAAHSGGLQCSLPHLSIC